MIVSVNGQSVCYQGAGSGSQVLLLHGWGANKEAWTPVLADLAQDYSVTAIDFPGFGQSPPPPAAWDVGDYARLTIALMDALSIERPTIIGHSFGGRVAIVLSSDNPSRVDKMILVDSAGIRPASTAKSFLMKSAIRAGKAVLGLPGFGSLGQKAREAARERLGSEDYQAAGPLRDTFVRVVNEDLRPRLPLIKAPTLLIWGELDDTTPVSDARIMEAEIPDAGLVVLPGAGHFSYLDRLPDFLRITRTFLAQSQ